MEVAIMTTTVLQNAVLVTEQVKKCTNLKLFYNGLQIGVVADYLNENYMKNKDIHEWLLDEGIDPLTTVTTEKGEYYLSDILEKHLTEQLRLFAVVGRSEQLPCDECVDGEKWSPYYGKYVKCDCRK
jgi:hypothetical protein